ncbi:acyl-CoA dehydrogenase family protein [Qipengyuania marisflavi]|uniref:Pimeloyl-CoA dehydrogenase small subunit n=1 Tax=Qipengyuania marisflavi TaxID=2486356 RepID=A0A5S3P0F8_9SPHN|nr:acyl-CoA dehydrogenase family protein [Qipengyuania marisflavi]TMM46114.1 pimeloyl-CoA dehydrogenase small subunit [Qipengyuania marisflavi]
MDFTIGEDRQMLADSLSRTLADKFDWKTREAAIDSDAGFSREVWNALAELGVIGALFGEDTGGYGGSAWDVGVVFGELGKALATGPFLGSLMAGKMLEAAGDEAALAPVIAGETMLTFGHEGAVEANGRPCPPATAKRNGDQWIISGRKGVVEYLGSADQVLVTAQTDAGLSAFLVDMSASGVEARDYPVIDGGSAGELTLTDTPATLVGEDGGATEALAAATASGLVATCWESIAVMDVLRDQTLDYLRTRKQFGIPIGKFQALQHRMATLALEIEQARSSAINAAANFDKDATTRDRFCSAAKYTAGKVGRLAAEESIQLHGGIGMTWEFPLSHYAKRLTMLNHVLGDDDHHLARYMALGQAAG